MWSCRRAKRRRASARLASTCAIAARKYPRAPKGAVDGDDDDDEAEKAKEEDDDEEEEEEEEAAVGLGRKLKRHTVRNRVASSTAAVLLLPSSCRPQETRRRCMRLPWHHAGAAIAGCPW